MHCFPGLSLAEVRRLTIPQVNGYMKRAEEIMKLEAGKAAAGAWR